MPHDRTIRRGGPLALTTLLFLAACTGAPQSRPGSLSPGERAIAESKDLLPDSDLVAAIPEGFELDRIVRNDLLFDREGWVTVGVRLRSERVSHARVIFYVLGREAAARALFEDQSRKPKSFHRSLGGPKPFSVTGVEPSVCGGSSVGIYACHTTGGRIYLVVASGTHRAGSTGFDKSLRRYVEELLTSFASLIST